MERIKGKYYLVKLWLLGWVVCYWDGSEFQTFVVDEYWWWDGNIGEDDYKVYYNPDVKTYPIYNVIDLPVFKADEWNLYEDIKPGNDDDILLYDGTYIFTGYSYNGNLFTREVDKDFEWDGRDERVNRRTVDLSKVTHWKRIED